jgi:LAO/AO transport system kinase
VPDRQGLPAQDAPGSQAAPHPHDAAHEHDAAHIYAPSASAGAAQLAGDRACADSRRPGRGPVDAEALVAAARDQDPRALARLVSLVENASPQLRDVMRVVAPLAGGAQVVGLTGSPGVGKSTVTGALIRAYRDRGLRVGVLAVDPTSPFSGGALLGDRVRMQEHATDPGVYIRSMASRGHLGGLAWATPQALRILDAAGFDVLLVETVGVGQAEVEIASLADSTLVVVAPGMGDSIQAAKAGILEVADVFVVNKSDRPGAQEAVRDLRSMLAMAKYEKGDWKPPIVKTAASAGDGIADLVAAVDARWAWLAESGHRDRLCLARAREEVAAIAVAELRLRLGGLPGEARLEELASLVAAGELDPYTAADALITT